MTPDRPFHDSRPVGPHRTRRSTSPTSPESGPPAPVEFATAGFATAGFATIGFPVSARARSNPRSNTRSNRRSNTRSSSFTRTALLLLAAAALLLTAGPVAAQDGDLDPTGLWLTAAESAVVEIERCDDELCGRVYWLEDDAALYDEENPDRDLRDRPLCGLPILWGFEQNPDRPGEWRDGQVYAADDGNTYSARIRVQDAGELELRGYRGIALFGRSESWTRVSSDDFDRCEPPSAR